MGWAESVADAVRNLTANKLRSGLAMLGVIIGVAAVITMVSIVEGGRRRVVEAIERLGTNLLFVSPKTLSAAEQREYSGRSKGLVYEDAEAVAAQLPAIQHVAPMVSISERIVNGDRDFNGTISGTTPAYQPVRNFYAERGRFISREDMTEWRRVAVLGRDVAEKLFGQEDPLEREIKIGGERFIVIGLMEKKGSLHGQNFDAMTFIPATTAMRRLQGTAALSYFLAQVDDRRAMKETHASIEQLLAQRHNGVKDFEIHSQEDFLSAIDRTVWTFRFMLGGIAAVSLLVGGIGIMNIMLVTVTERTREIGLRKAIGATRRAILHQFLIESVTISLAGGAIGAVSGVGLAVVLGKIVARAMPGQGDWGAAISPTAILLSFGFAVAVGVFFGLYPARKAASLDPVEALRYE
ncbi:MAG: ABC transporter permease [Nitrospirota bacterium]